jgi:hypothetical protein
MTTYTLPHFGQLSTENIADYYDVDIDFNGSEIQIDLNFENKSINTSTLDNVKNFIERIEKFDTLNKTYILNDYNNEDGETVKSYLEHHLEVVEKDKLSTIISFDNTTINPEQQLFTKLKLVRVGLYPESKNIFAVFDYSIGKDITNYLVVINTNENGELHYMTTES